MILEVFTKAYRQRLMAAVLALFAVLTLLSACGKDAEVEDSSKVQTSSEELSSEAQQKAGYGVYVDGIFVAALENDAEAQEAIADITAVLVDVYGAPEGLHSLKNDVCFVKGGYAEEAFTDSTGLKTLLGDEDDVYSFDISDVYGNSVDTELGIVTTIAEYTETPIAHGSDVTKTDALEAGKTVTVTEGKDGTLRDAYSVTYVNGVLTEKVLESSVVTVQPESAVIWEGTTDGASLMAADEKLAFPYDGRISSGYGPRSLFGGSFHNGIDIIAHVGNCYGHEIKAAADGVVVFSGYHSGYGLKVVIDHGDGLSTLYAHCSKSLVSVGDAVLKGQPVALIGATGRVTGPHLHFEVLSDSVPVNPESYIDWSTYNGSK